MTDDQQQRFDRYSQGALSEDERLKLLEEIQNSKSLKHAWDEYKLAQEVLKADDEASIRGMLREIDNSRKSSSSKGNYNKWWIFASLMAALVIIVGVALVEFNKLEPVQVADQYRLKGEQRIQRSGDPVSTDSLLTIKYYRPLQLANDFIDKEQYGDARQAIKEITLEAEVIQQNKEWMLALISYMENGRSDPFFQEVLRKILDDDTHNNYPQAVKLNNKVNNFWGRLRG